VKIFTEIPYEHFVVVFFLDISEILYDEKSFKEKKL
jgi:hypothetical protein